MQNFYASPMDIVFLKPVLMPTGERGVNVFSERGEFLWQSRNPAVAEVIARANGFTPVSVH